MPRLRTPLTAASSFRRTAGQLAGAVVGLTVALTAAAGAWTVSAPMAGAAAGSRASHHSHSHDAKKPGHQGGGLPAISHSKDLSAEPVVHRGKGRPPTKLRTKDFVKGTGAVVTRTSTVVVKYVGANYTTGKDFTQETWQTGQPATFPLSGVVPGFAEGLVGMRVGGRREIVIPPRLGYRNQATGPIKANETLVFVVDLVAVGS